MIKHTQTIRRQFADELFELFGHFVGLALKGLKNNAAGFQNTTIVFSSLSDFHNLVLAVLKTSITKSKPKKITHRYHKNFNSIRFNNELNYVLGKEKIMHWTKFDEMFLQILNKHAPIKSKLLRANHASNISKPLRKAIIKKSYLENLYFIKPGDHSLKNYEKQKNYCSRLYRKKRKNFF